MLGEEEDGEGILELELSITKPPRSVKTWWTEFPDDYLAKDPLEQPYRILTTKRISDGRELLTYWRRPDGSTVENREIMRVKPDGTWTFEIPRHPLGLRILDEFSARAAPDGGGTRLHIRSTLTPLEAAASARIGPQKERMAHLWKSIISICERDAP